LKAFLNKTHSSILNVLFLGIMERMEIIIILNYVMGRDFLSLVISIE
jgi:hypothetical protein